MKVGIYRMMAYTPVRDLTPDPDNEPFPLFSFEPIGPEDTRSLIGSGPFPWIRVDVPEGSRIQYDALFLPGGTAGLSPLEVLYRFAPAVLKPPVRTVHR